MKVRANGALVVRRGIGMKIMSLRPEQWNTKIFGIDDNIYSCFHTNTKIARFISLRMLLCFYINKQHSGEKMRN